MKGVVLLEGPPSKDDLPGGASGAPAASGPVAEIEDTQAPEERPEHALVCRSCGQAVSSSRHQFCFRGTSPVQVFPNPLGHMMKIITLRAAHDLRGCSHPTEAFTWFAGYTWIVVVCARCQTHLGWQYDTATGSTPARFFGLLADRISEGPAPGGPA